MSKNTKQNKRGRGRPAFDFNLPTGKLTINSIWEANPQFDCRLSVYNHVKRLIKRKVLARTREKIATGGVGKPMDVFIKVSALKAAKTRKENLKAKLANVPPVDLTPAPAPVDAVSVAA